VKYECQKNGVSLKGSIAKHFRSDELLHCIFIIQSAGVRIFKIGEHLVKLLHGRMVDFVTHPIRFTLLPSKMQNSPDK